MAKIKPPCAECDKDYCNGIMFDSVIIYTHEVARLRKLGAKIERDIPFSQMSMVIKDGCMFLKEGRCSIYRKRPLSCQTFDCRPDHERYE